MTLHILSACGTFMAGLSLIAKEMGKDVIGHDQNTYPPMSTMLESAGIQVVNGYSESFDSEDTECVVIGNALSRGNVAVETVLDKDLVFTSGPAWLHEHVLRGRNVIAVAGTHGKTTVTSMVAHILNEAEQVPGFLIGGVASNLGISARLGNKNAPFVIEADEYDSAFFDKRSKFVHYFPNILIINNLEFDHADIFESLNAIQKQFHHLVRTVSRNGTIIVPDNIPAIEEVLDMGCWSQVKKFHVGQSSEKCIANWQLELIDDDASNFTIRSEHNESANVCWGLFGLHNAGNALAAVMAAYYAGVDLASACRALNSFRLPKRRLELKTSENGICIYDDFAHHPTAIQQTLLALRQRVGSDKKIIAVFDPATRSMREGTHVDGLESAFTKADEIHLYQRKDMDWQWQTHLINQQANVFIENDTQTMARQVLSRAQPGDQILIMSNGSFNGFTQYIVDLLSNEN